MSNQENKEKKVRRKPGRPITIDYEKSFADQSRCPSCKCITTPDDYKHRTVEGRIVKTCFKCRDGVIKCMNKREPRTREKMRDKIIMYQKILDKLPFEMINELIENNDDLRLPERV